MVNNYTFIFKNNGWWLKISTLEQYMNYRELTDSKKYGDIFKDLINVSNGYHEQNAASTAILFKNQQYRGSKSLIELVSDFATEVTKTQLDLLLSGYYLLFNECGGYHFDTDTTYKWINKKELIFPQFTTNDIKIEKFPNGQHYYAYVGLHQVRDGDILKWNTYKEAYEQALKYVDLRKEK